MASLTIEVEQTCNEGAPLAYRITTDGPASIRLSDGRELKLAKAGEHAGAIGG